MKTQQDTAQQWFRSLRDTICNSFETLEQHALNYDGEAGTFKRKIWEREGGGGGEMSLMYGRLFEKVGVNISTVHGEFSDQFRVQIPGASDDPRFWASGISLVAHMQNPHIPAIHMNTRFIIIGDGGNLTSEDASGRWWFGGGTDLNPMFQNDYIETQFHNALKACCDAHDTDYYEKYKQWCDEYFFIPHRGEARGAGGIFYDYLSTDWNDNLRFTQDVGRCFACIYPQIVRDTMNQSWTEDDRQHQLFRRGRYAEFNLVHDRGTKFGLMTGGNAEAILMSLPPVAQWREDI